MSVRLRRGRVSVRDIKVTRFDSLVCTAAVNNAGGSRGDSVIGSALSAHQRVTHYSLTRNKSKNNRQKK